MKKSRVFMGVAALSLVVAGVFANKTAKKFALSNLYYYHGATYTGITSPGCLASIFTTTVGTNIARIKAGSAGPYSLYYFVSGMTYAPVYNYKF